MPQSRLVSIPRLLVTAIMLSLLLASCATAELVDPGACGDGILQSDMGEQCDDGNTFEGDGCSDSCQLERQGTELSCVNGSDDDGDSFIDCNDPDCRGDLACPETVEGICNNGTDDDGDHATDCQDSDCANDPVCQNPTTENLCDDAVDNDADLATDCADSDCSTQPACQTGGETICDNHVDDDADTATDCEDNDCAARACGPNGLSCQGTACTCPSGTATETACGDGKDGDCDGKTDCLDTDCAADVNCTGRESLCGDGLDNDGDTLTDCGDNDCATQACSTTGKSCAGGQCVCSRGTTENNCTDNIDNDCDGLTDCFDSECSAAPGCSQSETVCNDNVDNDGDTKKDCADLDCTAQTCGTNGKKCAATVCACPGGAVETLCSDSSDNDCDGLSDCADSDCATHPSCVESVCNDNLDNDGDTQKDCADADCAGKTCGLNGRTCSGTTCSCPGGATESACGDLQDNDCDGSSDCSDSDCAASPACAVAGTCDIDAMILCGLGDQRTTVGQGSGVNAYSCTASSETGPEFIYEFLATTDVSVTLSLTGLASDLDLMLLSDPGIAGCDAQQCLSSSTTSGNESITFSPTPGDFYSIAVDGKDGASGDYSLNVDCTGGSTCVATYAVDCGFSESYTTTYSDASNNVTNYNCATYNESGPEYTYLFLPTQSGTATVNISMGWLGPDLDLFVLDFNAGVCDPTQCIEYGDDSISFPITASNAYYVVVDGYYGDSGDYDIEFLCN